jgi:superfamily II helicase
MARLRAEKRKELLALNDETTGWKVCTKCLHNKRLSEFSSRSNSRVGKLNKLCDTCLTRVYNSDARRSEGFDEVWWRNKAYTCISSGRPELAKRRNTKISEI